MGEESSLGAIEDNISPFDIVWVYRLHRDELSLSDAGIHASATGPEAHSGTPAQKLSGQIQK